MADSSIEWTDWTWNPVAGCTVITAGCTNCYAMRMAARLAAMGSKKYRGLTRRVEGDTSGPAQFGAMRRRFMRRLCGGNRGAYS
jgi:protein gp37